MRYIQIQSPYCCCEWGNSLKISKVCFCYQSVITSAVILSIITWRPMEMDSTVAFGVHLGFIFYPKRLPFGSESGCTKAGSHPNEMLPSLIIRLLLPSSDNSKCQVWKRPNSFIAVGVEDLSELSPANTFGMNWNTELNLITQHQWLKCLKERPKPEVYGFKITCFDFPSRIDCY